MKESKLTKRERKAVSKAFALVAKQLPPTISLFSSDDRSPYICDNLTKLSLDASKVSIATVDLCKDIIKARIDCHYSFVGWLKVQSAQVANEVREDGESGGRLIQAHRIAWCKMLAKEFAS